MKAVLTLIVTVLSMWGIIPVAAVADDDGAVTELIDVLGKTGSLRGNFEQSQYDTSGKILAKSTGEFKMLRPGYFSWEITSPDSQLILATPTFIWHYDKDLETLTRRPVTDSSEMSPLQILGGREDILRSRFVVEINAEGGFLIKPNSDGGASAGFLSLVLSIDKDVVSGMEIVDSLNQRVQINFENVDRKTALSPDDFAFTPPDGVDQFYYDQ